MQRSLFEGKPHVSVPSRRAMMQMGFTIDDLMDPANDLRSERESLIRRIKPGKSGVNDLRLRLKLVTHELIKVELGI